MTARSDANQKAIVAPFSIDAEHLQSVFPGWLIIRSGAAICGRMFSRLVMLWEPKTVCEANWHDQTLVSRLKEGVKVEWMV